jgi:phosphorylase/glycogen(starch) synthase
MRNEGQDGILQTASRSGLLNRAEDRVKILFFPIYFDGTDGIFNLPLYQIVSGFDLGVFPSLYEPWGYTPMESLVMGVPAITSTLAGFGRALDGVDEKPDSGAFLLNRRDGDWEGDKRELANQLEKPLNESSRAWLLRRMSAYTMIQDFTWDQLYSAYEAAYSQALSTENK